jgi:hypothetical protein
VNREVLKTRAPLIGCITWSASENIFAALKCTLPHTVLEPPSSQLPYIEPFLALSLSAVGKVPGDARGSLV